MGIYYKATQLDGTDFHTGSVDYAAHLASGEPLPTKRDVEYPQCCTGTVYHASTSKADTLIGGAWPCRLFEVEGESVASEDNKRGFYTFKVVRALPAHEALGPNGEAVVALIGRAGQMTPEQVRDLAAAGAGAAAGDAARAAAGDAAWDAARAAAGGAAGGAARAAACALVVKDLITTEQFNLLYGPWASVMEKE